jgi:hypothetical protein
MFRDFSSIFPTVFVVKHSHRDLNSLPLSTESTYLLVPMSWICFRVVSHVHRSPHTTARVVAVSLPLGRSQWLTALKSWRSLSRPNSTFLRALLSLTPWPSVLKRLHQSLPSPVSLFETFSLRKCWLRKRGSQKKRDRCPGLDTSDQSLRDVFNYVS